MDRNKVTEATRAQVTAQSGQAVIGADARAAMAVVSGESRVAMAVVPRDPKAVVEAVKNEARVGGARWFYSWTVKTKRGPEVISGPSVRLALSLARLWRNLDVQVSVEAEDADAWILRAVATDVESRFSVTALFRQSKRVPGAAAMDPDRALDIAFQIGQSKVVRNALTKVLPDWLVQIALNHAKAAAAQAASGGKGPKARATAEAIAEVRAALAEFGVTDGQIERRLGHPLEEATGEEVALLQAIATALQEGQTSVQNEFPITPDPVPESAVAANPAAAKAVPGGNPKLLMDLKALAAALGLSEEDLAQTAQEQGIDLAALTPHTYAAMVTALQAKEE